MHSNSSDINSTLAPKIGLPPALSAAGSRNGTAISRAGAASAQVVVLTGAVTGTPSATSVVVKLQGSADGSNNWTDIPGATATVAAASSVISFGASLQTAPAYIRAVETVAFTGGTTPNVLTGTVVNLGGGGTLPPT